jgi:hypothetical protein
MRNLVLALLVLSCFAATGLPQQDKNSVPDSDVRISKDKPGIYITFERLGKAINPMDARMAETGESSKSKEKGNDVWLRLHNNTRWAIGFPTLSLYLGKKLSPYRLPNGRNSFGLGDGMEVNVVYRVLESDGRVVPYGSDNSSSSLLPPGRSIIFSVRRDHLSKGRSIYVEFEYEWEFGQVYSNNLAPVHRTEYYGNRLEDDLK